MSASTTTSTTHPNIHPTGNLNTNTNTSSSNDSSLSVSIGGRLVSPALPIIDASVPTSTEISFQNILTSYAEKHIPIETPDGLRQRERVLNRLGALCTEWVQHVSREASLPDDVVQRARGLLYTSGSYRLGVHEPGADMDVVLVCPSACTRKDFFGSGYIPPDMDLEALEAQQAQQHQDPQQLQALRETIRKMRDPMSLAERIRHHPDVTNFVPVENAAVPILTFDWEGVNIDLLFARLHSRLIIPPDFDINDDLVLDGVDNATEKSLNGPRVTNLLAALVSGTTQRYQTFLTVVRCIRKWAKARGLYSNKMGYLGGVNINIGVALTIQLYPNACAASLLRKFFLVFKSWRWPNPVILTKPHDAGYGLTVWSSAQSSDGRQHNVAPMITPAYPAMNSSASISRQTLQILHEEFCRGHEILDKAWKTHVAIIEKGEALNQNDVNSNPERILEQLFEPSDFFIAYPYYISLCIVGPTESDAQTWTGFVESRLRKLVSDMLGRSLPLSKIQLWPKKLDVCVADRTALLTSNQRKNSVTYFVGFQVDTLRMKGTSLNVEQQMQKFSQYELSKFHAPWVNGMDLLVKSFTVKTLPTVCFEGIYDGGKLTAMKKRRMLRDLDPARIAAKNKAKLAELKARMEQMNKKKMALLLQSSAAAAATTTTVTFIPDVASSKKRKKEQDDNEDDNSDINMMYAKNEVTNNLLEDANIVKKEEEEDLLEHALDGIQGEIGQDGNIRSREEAEIERQKLISGLLLMEDTPDEETDLGGGADDEEDEDYIGMNREKVDSDENNAISIAEREAAVLRRSGYNIVSDDEIVVVGGNRILPWRHPKRTKPEICVLNSVDTSSIQQDEGRDNISKLSFNAGCLVEIKFTTKFDVIELDANGNVIDKGDNDFMPSLRWSGRRPGFEFKLGERGLGYYRTGRPVIVPSNKIAYGS